MARRMRRRSAPRKGAQRSRMKSSWPVRESGEARNGRAQGVEEGADGGHRRAGAEEVGEGRGDVRVDGLLLEGGVFEEGVEGLERGVDVGDPEQEELFERGLAVGQAVGRAAQPLGGGELAAEDGGVGELLGEGEEELVEFGGFELRGEPADGLGEDGGVELLAVAGDEGVGELVDEAHGEEGAGVEGGGGIGVGARTSFSAAARRRAAATLAKTTLPV